MLASVRRALHKLFSWSAWPKLAAIATALAAVAALWFSAQSLKSTERQYALSQEGQVTDRFTKAVEQLGSEKMNVRLGGIYSLERISRDSPADVSVVFAVLSAFVRSNASKRQECVQDGPSEDVQGALTVIGRRMPSTPEAQDPDPRSRIDLGAACLPGIDWTGANLTNVFLSAADLTGSDLHDAELSDCQLANADMKTANLQNAELNHAVLIKAKLMEANLTHASLRESALFDADLTGAILVGADLTDALLKGAILRDIYYDRSTTWPEGFTPPPSAPSSTWPQITCSNDSPGPACSGTLIAPR